MPLTHCVFPVSPDVVVQCMRLMNNDSWWICHMPLMMSNRDHPGSRSVVGMAGHPQFTLEDMMDMAQLPFNSERGLWARRMVILLENVSELLISCGLYLTPNSFLWDNRVTGPLISGEHAI